MYIIQHFHTFQVNIWDSKDDSQNPVLLEKNFKYIDPGTCRKISPNKFYQFVTFDKFCTNFTQGNTILDSNFNYNSSN